ncbi:hypothetical protein THAOC_01015, partial [Thalassiosira oceanica]
PGIQGCSLVVMEGPKVEEQPEKDGGHGGLSFFHGQGRALRLYGGVRNRFVRTHSPPFNQMGISKELWVCYANRHFEGVVEAEARENEDITAASAVGRFDENPPGGYSDGSTAAVIYIKLAGATVNLCIMIAQARPAEVTEPLITSVLKKSAATEAHNKERPVSYRQTDRQTDRQTFFALLH